MPKHQLLLVFQKIQTQKTALKFQKQNLTSRPLKLMTRID